MLEKLDPKKVHEVSTEKIINMVSAEVEAEEIVITYMDIEDFRGFHENV